MTESKSLYKNIFLLNQLVPPSNDFKKCFKEGMFDKPNTTGFINVSHYLLNVYDEERFKKLVEWPILEKKLEGKYRNEVRDFITIISNENPDIQFPTILTSHLFHAGGNKFTNIMHKLSQAVLKNFLKRQLPNETIMDCPRAGPSEELSKKMLNNIIADKSQKIIKSHERFKEIENKAKIVSQNLAESIEKNQSETFELKQQLAKIIFDANVHPDMKKRMIDPNDTEVIDLWKNNVSISLKYLNKQMKKLKIKCDTSERVSIMVNSILTNNINCLDGNNLSYINVDKFLQLNNLKPELQVALHHLYDDNNKLNLTNFIIVFNCVLEIIETNLLKYGYPDFNDCNMQIDASVSDLISMNKLVDNLETLMTSLTVELQNEEKNNNNNNNQKKYENLTMQLSQDVFDSVILKSSPTIQFHSNGYDAEKNEALKRLELTPVEGVHKSLFSRYKNDDNQHFTPKTIKSRIKIPISRINFDDKISPVKKFIAPPPPPLSSASTSFTSQTITNNKTAKFSRLFAGNTRTNFANCNISSSSSWKMNTLGDTSFGMSIRDFSVAGITSPERPSMSIINNIDKPAFNSTEITSAELTTINENSEINKNTSVVITRKKNHDNDNNDIDEKKHKRRSISDLVERYKKIRETSGIPMENNHDISDDI